MDRLERHFSFICPIALLLAAVGGCGDDPFIPTLTEHPCELDVPMGLSASDFRCGTMEMLLDREDSGGPTVRVELAVLLARSGSPEPDPLVFYGGGPGVPTLDGYLPAQAATALSSINETRDVIFMDLRGSGRSTPSLTCPEYDAALIESFATNLSPAEDRSALVEGYRLCRERLDAEGVPTSHHHSKAIVEDTIEILDALGYEGQVNVYGISYGGRIAQVFVREHPERTRSVILDSPTNVHRNFAVEWAANFDVALDAFFAACAASATCAMEHPNLQDDLFAAAAALDASPVEVSFEGNTVVINGPRILRGAHSVFYDPSLLLLLPNAIDGVLAGATLVVQALAPGLLDTRGFSQGHYASVLAAEEFPFFSEETLAAANEGLRPELLDAVDAVNGSLFLEVADVWPVEARPAIENEPVSTDVPVLVLSGEFDPAAPLPSAEAAVSISTNGQLVTFRGHGHGIIRSPHPEEDPTDTCGRALVDAFLAAPMAPVDSACADALPPLF